MTGDPRFLKVPQVVVNGGGLRLAYCERCRLPRVLIPHGVPHFRVPGDVTRTDRSRPDESGTSQVLPPDLHREPTRLLLLRLIHN